MFESTNNFCKDVTKCVCVCVLSAEIQHFGDRAI